MARGKISCVDELSMMRCLKLKKLYELRNAVLMSVRHLPYTVLMAVICACPVLLVSFAPTFKVQATIILICLVIGGAVVAYCNSFFLVKIFENYIPENAENPDGGKAE